MGYLWSYLWLVLAELRKVVVHRLGSGRRGDPMDRQLGLKQLLLQLVADSVPWCSLQGSPIARQLAGSQGTFEQGQQGQKVQAW